MGKDKNISITIENKIYTNPEKNSQGLVPPQYEPAYVSDLRQMMTGRNIHGGRSNANPFAYSPSSQVFTSPAGHPVYNVNNYGNPPPAFGHQGLRPNEGGGVAPATPVATPVATPPATPVHAPAVAPATPPPAVGVSTSQATPPATPVVGTPAPVVGTPAPVVPPLSPIVHVPATPLQIDIPDYINTFPPIFTPELAQAFTPTLVADDDEEDDDLEDDDIDDEVIDIAYESDDDDEADIDTSMDPVLRDRYGPWFSKKGRYLITALSDQALNKRARREIERDHYLKGIIGRRPNKNTQKKLGFGPNSVLRIERALRKIKQADLSSV